MALIETSKTVSVPGGEVRVFCLSHDTTPADAIPLVYIHGGPGGTHGTAKKYLAPLAERFPLYFYDQLGSYHSPAPFSDELMRPERFTEELHAILTAHTIPRALLLGHSWGACIAIDYALTHPDRVAGVHLSSPLISTPRWIADANALLDNLPDDMCEAIRYHEEAGTTDDPAYIRAADEFYNRHFCRLDPWPQDILDSFPKTNKALYTGMWGPSEFRCTGTLKTHDRFPDLPRLTMPVMLTAGRYDEARPETMEDAAALIPDSRVTIFEHSAHVAYIEESDAYRAAIAAFMAELQGRSGQVKKTS